MKRSKNVHIVLKKGHFYYLYTFYHVDINFMKLAISLSGYDIGIYYALICSLGSQSTTTEYMYIFIY